MTETLWLIYAFTDDRWDALKVVDSVEEANELLYDYSFAGSKEADTNLDDYWLGKRPVEYLK